MLAGQPFAFALGWAGTWTRLFQSERIALRFKAAKAAGVLRVRHRFHDAYEVEICARYAAPVSVEVDTSATCKLFDRGSGVPTRYTERVLV